MFKKKDEVNLLELIPVRKFAFKTNENGLVDIHVPKFKNKFMVKYLIPKMKYPFINANLDEIGSETWLLIDGQNKFEDIADKLILKFGDKVHPVHERLKQFITQMYKNGFIDFNNLKKG